MKRFGLMPLALFLIFLQASIVGISYAQEFDYEKYPRLNFNFTELSLDLTVNPESMELRGTAAYELSANIGGVDSLLLQASHMDIASVRINDNEAGFSLQNDSLIIRLPDSTIQGRSYSLGIDYSTVPKFGMLSNDVGTVWTS
ncbi:MAG: hypothetical protein R3222_09550, partial [Balneolaceae bacterium]|nr:hypothetical protein [Balneolaceae bacterium]